MKIRYKKTTFSNGLRVVTESHPLSQSFCVGAWVLTGSRDEGDQEKGISHFIEHLVFKGTKKRSSYQIASSLESLGGDLNAYTTKEYSCYHGLSLNKDSKIAVDVICDLISQMSINKKDFDLEKKVILQEMALAMDNQEDMIHEEFFDRIYAGHPLSGRILGTESSIASLTLKQVTEFYKNRYRPENVIISAAGNLKHDQIVSQIKKFFPQLHIASSKELKAIASKKLKATDSQELKTIDSKELKTIDSKAKKMVVQKTNSSSIPLRVPPPWNCFRDVIERSSEQVHILIGFPVPSFRDQNRFESFVLNSYLGGGMTSSLFQSVREKKGLVYNIQSMLNTHEDCGVILIYASTELQNVALVVDLIQAELKKIKKRGIEKKFIDRFKTQVMGQILLGSDDIENRMNSLGINEMVFGEYRSVEQITKDIKSVTEKTMKKYLKDQFHLDQTSGLLLGTGVNELKEWWQNVFSKN